MKLGQKVPEIKTGNEAGGESVGFHNLGAHGSSLVTYESLQMHVSLVLSLNVKRLSPAARVHAIGDFYLFLFIWGLLEMVSLDIIFFV